MASTDVTITAQLSGWRSLVEDQHAVREWMGVFLGVVIAFLMGAGLGEVRNLRADFTKAETRVAGIEVALAAHIESANAANLTLAKILASLDGRMKRIEEWSGGGDGRRGRAE